MTLSTLTHYVPPRNFSDIEKEFVEPTPSDYFIWWLFRRKCVVCRKPATEINEIVPRGRTKKSLMIWTNRVTICRECHDNYHRNGVTPEKISNMQTKRKEFLLSSGREEYANLNGTQEGWK